MYFRNYCLFITLLFVLKLFSIYYITLLAVLKCISEIIVCLHYAVDCAEMYFQNYFRFTMLAVLKFISEIIFCNVLKFLSEFLSVYFTELRCAKMSFRNCVPFILCSFAVSEFISGITCISKKCGVSSWWNLFLESFLFISRFKKPLSKKVKGFTFLQI